METLTRIIVLHLILLSFPGYALSQISSYGFKMGLQTAGIYSSLTDDGRVIGGSIYGFTDIELTNNIFTTFEAGFTQRGFKNRMIETNEIGEQLGTLTAASGMSYLTVASLINIILSESAQEVYAGAGPRFNWLVHRDAGDFNFTSVSIQDDTVNGLDTFALGGTLAAGAKNLQLLGSRFHLEARFEVDVTDSFSQSPAEVRSNVFMILFGFHF